MHRHVDVPNRAVKTALWTGATVLAAPLGAVALIPAFFAASNGGRLLGHGVAAAQDAFVGRRVGPRGGNASPYSADQRFSGPGSFSSRLSRVAGRAGSLVRSGHAVYKGVREAQRTRGVFGGGPRQVDRDVP